MKLVGNRCQCRACGEYFNSVSSFDRHRAGDWQNRGSNRRCRAPDELIAKGWSKNTAGYWIEKARARLDAPAIGGNLAQVIADQRVAT